MPETPKLLGLALVAFGVALAVLASTILWRRQALRLRRIFAGMLLVTAVLLYSYAPGPPSNRPAPLPGSALLYALIPTGQGVSPGASPQGNKVGALSARSGSIVWSHALPDLYGRGLTLFDGMLFVQTFAGSGTSGHICALRASDGAEDWQYAYTGRVVFTFSLGAGVLFVPTVDTNSGDSQITAVRALDGRQLWQWTGQHMTLDQAPILMAKALYFMASSSQAGGGGGVTAVDASSGRLLWQRPIEQPASGRVSLAADADAVYTTMIGSADSNSDIAAFRASDGLLLWTTEAETSAPQLISSSGGIVYIQLAFGIAAFSAVDGRQLWRFGAASDPQSAGALDISDTALSGTTFYIAADRTGTVTNSEGRLTNPEAVFALDAVSGAQLWKHATASASGGLLNIQPTVAYIYADDGLSALDPSSGRLLWRSSGYTVAPFTLLPGSDDDPVSFLTSSHTICQLVICENKVQQYLSAVDQRDGLRYWIVPIGPPQQIIFHLTF